MTKQGKGDEFDDLFPDEPPMPTVDHPQYCSEPDDFKHLHVGVEQTPGTTPVAATRFLPGTFARLEPTDKDENVLRAIKEVGDAISRALGVPKRYLDPPDGKATDNLVRSQMKAQFPEMPEDEVEKAIALANEMHKAIQFSIRYGRPHPGIAPVYVNDGASWQLAGASIVGAGGNIGPILQMPSAWNAGPSFNPPDDPNMDEPEDDETDEGDEPDDDETDDDEWGDLEDE